MKAWSLILLVVVVAGCSVIYAAKNSTVNTHDGDLLFGTNKMTRIEITR